MNETIEIQKTVRDPNITAAIREIKESIKEMGQAQKTGKMEHRNRQRMTSLKIPSAIPVNPWIDQSRTITAMHLIYAKLRQTKRPHLNEKAYFYPEGADCLGINRRYSYNQMVMAITSKHPATAALLKGV